MHTVTPGGKVTNRLSTTDELAAMRARVDGAVPGPWTWTVGSVEATRDGETFEIVEREDLHQTTRNDVEFIAHARTDVPRLLDAVDAVLAMHEPVSRSYVLGETFDECSYCVDPQDSTWRLDYPCPTVQAITSALGVSE